MNRYRPPLGAALAACVLLAAAGARGDSDRPVPPPPPRFPSVLRLEDALRLLEDHSLDVASADAAVRGARAQVRLAGAVPNPSLGFGLGRSWDCPAGTGCTSPLWSGSLGDQGALAFLVTGQRGLAVDAAEQGLRAAGATRDDVLRNQTFQVKQQFVNTAVAARALQFTREEASLAAETVALARKRLSAGAISEADVARLEVLQMQLEQAVNRAEQAYLQARVALAQLLGSRPASAEFEVDPTPVLTAAVPPRLAGATLGSLTEEAGRRRPDAVAARAQVEQARLAASLARRQLIPQFTLQLSYSQQGSTGNYFTPPTGTIGLNVPIPVFYQQQGQIGQADATAQAAEVSLARLETQVAGDVATAWAAMTAARSAAERSERRLLDRSRLARDLVKIQYEKGAAGLLDLLDAERTHLSNQIDYLQLLDAYWVAVFQLEQAVGEGYLP